VGELSKSLGDQLTLEVIISVGMYTSLGCRTCFYIKSLEVLIANKRAGEEKLALVSLCLFTRFSVFVGKLACLNFGVWKEEGGLPRNG